MADLTSVKSDLSKIISDLQAVSTAISTEANNSTMAGIGAARCAQSINSVITKYQATLTSLNSVDQNSFSEGYGDDS